MAKIDLNRVFTFVQVVESGSFTRAAVALGLPISSVSRGVARLEEDLGVRLLQRSTRRLNLTEAGQQYYRRMQAVVGEVNEATEAVAGLGREPRGLVRVTTSVDAGVLSLAPLLARLTRQYPALEIDLTLTGRPLDLIEEGLDLAIRAGRLQDSSLMSRKLGEASLGIYAARGYLAERGIPRTFAGLARHACIRLRGRGGLLPWRLSGPRGPEEVAVTGPVIADDMMFVRQAVIEGLGLGLLPPPTMTAQVRENRVERVLPRYQLAGGGVFLVWPGRRLLSSAVVAVRDFLAAELPRLM